MINERELTSPDVIIEVENSPSNIDQNNYNEFEGEDDNEFLNESPKTEKAASYQFAEEMMSNNDTNQSASTEFNNESDKSESYIDPKNEKMLFEKLGK